MDHRVPQSPERRVFCQISQFFARFPNPTLDDLKSFIAEKLSDPENLQRLNPDGSVTRATVKALYDGQTQGVFNSVIANDFAERAGSDVGTIDRTKLGQLLFRSNLELAIPELQNPQILDGLNAKLSESFVSQNPVEKYVAFTGEKITDDAIILKQA